MELSPTILSVMDTYLELMTQADRLEAETLAAGAMREDFEVVLAFKPGWPSALTVELE